MIEENNYRSFALKKGAEIVKKALQTISGPLRCNSRRFNRLQ